MHGKGRYPQAELPRSNDELAQLRLDPACTYALRLVNRPRAFCLVRYVGTDAQVLDPTGGPGAWPFLADTAIVPMGDA